MSLRLGWRRGLLLAVVGGLAALLVFYRLPPGPPRGETDLGRVYVRLNRDPELSRLKTWCGLSVGPATAEEALTLRRAIEADEQKWMVDFPYRQPTFRNVIYHQRWFLDQLRWVRVYDDADRWIGLGVWERTDLDRTTHWIVYRVAIGFDPPYEAPSRSSSGSTSARSMSPITASCTSRRSAKYPLCPAI